MTVEFAKYLEKFVDEDMTQQQLANTSDLSQATISRILSGKLTLTTEAAFKLATALNIPKGELVEFLLRAGGISSETIDDFLTPDEFMSV